jgi:hypothetical protein
MTKEISSEQTLCCGRSSLLPSASVSREWHSRCQQYWCNLFTTRCAPAVPTQHTALALQPPSERRSKNRLLWPPLFPTKSAAAPTRKLNSIQCKAASTNHTLKLQIENDVSSFFQLVCILVKNKQKLCGATTAYWSRDRPMRSECFPKPFTAQRHASPHKYKVANKPFQKPCICG